MANDNKTLARFILDGLPPAPRGIPKIEVTFDIDANGILNVSAKDQATGREQKVTITASSGLSQAEIDQMMKEAEAHAAEDKQRRESIEFRNQAEAMTYQAERTLSDYGDKIPSETKLDLEAKVATVRDILANDPENIDRLRTAYDEMTQTLSQAGASMYEQAGAPEDFDPAAAGAEGATGEPAEDETTVEGEFREVGND
jgi:molecular chaperone DnaK